MRVTTPPWHVEVMLNGSLKVRNRYGESVCTVKRDNKANAPLLENANACLIAEAPAMWSIVKLVNRMRSMTKDSDEMIEAKTELDDALNGLFDRVGRYELEI